MSDCNHNCGSCSSDCDSRSNDFRKPLNEKSRVKKVIGVVSGKGGVGKSMVTTMLAIAANKSGARAAILDADITGPSIPKAFGIKEKATSDGVVMYPAVTKSGIEVMSINLLLRNDTDPVIWRGPVIANCVQQFWTDCVWDDIDVMFVDMPPGTGDVPLTVFQSLPVDGIIIVTTPQDLVSMIVGKAVNMADNMNIPILGMVENMSYFKCPDCGNNHAIFGESKIEVLSKAYEIRNYVQLPIDTKLANYVDAGKIEEYECESLEKITKLYNAVISEEN